MSECLVFVFHAVGVSGRGDISSLHSSIVMSNSLLSLSVRLSRGLGPVSSGAGILFPLSKGALLLLGDLEAGPEAGLK
mgnify:CR=1 FL=1